MITTVTLNPCNDVMYTVSEFVYGGMNRIASVREDHSGKGFNVARLLSLHGKKATATGLLYTQNGEATQKTMQKDGVVCDCVWQQGAVRTNTKILDASSGIVTEFNQAGVEWSEQIEKLLLEKIACLSQNSQYLIMSGSVPPNCPADIYRRIIKMSAKSCKCVLDAEGEKLGLGITARPFMVKPNKFELETAIRKKLTGIEEIAKAARDVTEQGVSVVCVTMGGEGALITDGKKTYFARLQNPQVNSTVGAGDCLMGGLIAALADGAGIDGALINGVACAGAALKLHGIQIPAKAECDQMLSRVKIAAMD